jgi:hypothetical protein
MGDLQFVNVSVDFTNGDTTRLSDEFVIALYHMYSSECVQFGPSLSSCKNLQAWPAHFHNNSDGLYTTLLDVQSFGFSFFEGMEYKVCVGNADRLTNDPMAYSDFVGEVGFFGLTKEIESTVVVTSDINIEFAVDFDLRVRREQTLCTSGYAWGNLTNVSITLDFTNGDMSQLSSEFILVIYNVNTGKCVQFGPGLELCDTHASWPASFQSVANGQYSGVVDINAFEFQTGDPSALFKVCVGNAELVSSNPQAYSYFVGDVSLQGMVTKTELSPTMAPTVVPGSNSDGLGDTEIILIGTLAPVGLLLIVGIVFLMWWKNVCHIRERDEMKEELFGADTKKAGGSIDIHQV